MKRSYSNLLRPITITIEKDLSTLQNFVLVKLTKYSRYSQTISETLHSVLNSNMEEGSSMTYNGLTPNKTVARPIKIHSYSECACIEWCRKELKPTAIVCMYITRYLGIFVKEVEGIK